ncbi:MAG: hypothetical protein ACOYT4_01660 [Nanoarchaeota archaeon]
MNWGFGFTDKNLYKEYKKNKKHLQPGLIVNDGKSDYITASKKNNFTITIEDLILKSIFEDDKIDFSELDEKELKKYRIIAKEEIKISLDLIYKNEFDIK